MLTFYILVCAACMDPSRMASNRKRLMTEYPKQRPAVAALPAYVAGRKASGARIAALASNESHFAPLPAVLAAITEAAGQVNRYPDMASIALRDAIAAAAHVRPENVASARQSGCWLSRSPRCDPGDEVVSRGAPSAYDPVPVGRCGGCPRAVGGGTTTPQCDGGGDHRATKVVLLCSPTTRLGRPSTCRAGAP